MKSLALALLSVGAQAVAIKEELSQHIEKQNTVIGFMFEGDDMHDAWEKLPSNQKF